MPIDLTIVTFIELMGYALFSDWERRVPTVEMDEAWHPGVLEPRAKYNMQPEGKGLLITTEPDAMDRILHRGKPPHTKVTRRDGKPIVLIDMLRLSIESIADLLDQAISQGWVVKAPVWIVYYHSGHLRASVRKVLYHPPSPELDGIPADFHAEPLIGLRPTSKLMAWWHERYWSDLPPSMVIRCALQAVLETNGHQGVWWNHPIDDVRKTVPHGIIFWPNVEQHLVRRDRPRLLTETPS